MLENGRIPKRVFIVPYRNRKQQKFFYTKVRKNISTPDKTDTYEKASAEVIVWF